jgi:high-affinity nickel-transport protein
MDFAALIILGNALILGIRHGIDWDHIAAIADIVGATATTKIDHGAISVLGQKDALRLSSFYAIGHATIVLILGLAALLFAAVLPEWIEPLMQRAVGCTLLALSAWIFSSLGRQATDRDEFVPQSRWMFVFAKLRQLGNWLQTQVTGKTKKQQVTISQYDAPAAFGIGLIHGFGAETGTQVLLIATVGASSSHFLGALILLTFVLGLLISNTLVAVLTCVGFVNSATFKPLFVTTSIVTGLFSLIVGTFFASGCGNALPDLQR